MKKIYQILYFIPVFLIVFLMSCTKEKLEVSASISSITATTDSISFYETTTSNQDIEARIILEKDNQILQQIDSIVVGTTTEYSFQNLEANTLYQICIQYRYETETYIKIAQKEITTKKIPMQDIVINCENTEVVYDGNPKQVTATASVSGLELDISYSQNGNQIEQPINVGEYLVTIHFEGNELYNPSTVERKLTIVKADILPNTKDLVITYDGQIRNKEIEEAFDLKGYNVKYTYYKDNQKVESIVDAGEYLVQAGFAGNQNYNAFEVTKKVIVNPSVIELDIQGFDVDYQQEYKVELDTDLKYTVAYYQGDKLLEGKPIYPGVYKAMIRLEEQNYIGTKEIEFTIHKIDYSVSYRDMEVIYGNSVSFEVDDFVQVSYYKNNEVVDDIIELGEYEVRFYFINHLFYKDFDYRIKCIVDVKNHIHITANDVLVEENTNYNITYTNDFDVELNITYYLGDNEVEKPSLSGIYKVILSYEEDDRYYESSKEIQLIIYPQLQDIFELEEGLYHIKGNVIAKDSTYSYLVNGHDVLLVKDVTLSLNKNYELIGSYENSGAVCFGTVLKKEETLAVSFEVLETSMIGYPNEKEQYFYKYIKLQGMVTYQNNQYGLTLEENYVLPLTGNFSSYYKNKTPIYIQMIPYGETFKFISFGTAVLTALEEVYAVGLYYTFEDIVDTLPVSTVEPYDVNIRYISSSNENVINPATMKVTPSNKEDVNVTLTVEFYNGNYTFTKQYTVKVLKFIDTELKIYSIEMRDHYGDSTLIQYGDFEILIDAGDVDDGAFVNRFLKEHISEDNHLDMVIVTHCHSDHMGGLAKLSNSDRGTKALDGIGTVGKIIDYGHIRTQGAGGKYMHDSWVSIRDKYVSLGAEYYPVYNCAQNINGASSHHQIDDKLSIDFVDTQTYATPEQDLKDELNIYSVATLLTYQNFRFFFAGDLEDKGESNLLKNISNTPLGKITNDNLVLYKAAHHGTDPGSNNGGTNGGNQLPFLKALKPDYFYISAAMCKEGNNDTGFIGDQKHPYPRCIANFLTFSDNIYFNGTNGTLEIITDGFDILSVHGNTATTNYLVNSATINYASQADLKLLDTLWYKEYRQTQVNSALSAL